MSDIDSARRASSARMLHVWSTLEYKYTLGPHEDDILDLRSGDFYMNRGLLTRTGGTWDIGCFADPEADPDLAPDVDEDEDESELDHHFNTVSKLDRQFNLVHIPPVRELDPQDAEDLRAFMVAEEARKAFHGVDDDLQSDTDAETEDLTLDVEAGSARLSPTESDDDLAGYDDTVGEGALLWEVSTELSNCSEPLGAEGGDVSKPIHARPRRNETPAQLRTPSRSRSRSSVQSPNTFYLPKRSPHPSPSPLDFTPPPPDPCPAPPMSYPVFSDHARAAGMTPHPDAGMVIAQAMQSLSYLAFCATQLPLTASSPQPSDARTPQASLSSSHSPSNSQYPAPYPHHPHGPHSHIPGSPQWPYPPFAYHHPPASLPPHPSHPHPPSHPPFTTLLSSPATPSTTPRSGGGPPSSSPGFSPSPGKGKRKRVSFTRSTSESDSSTAPDEGPEPEVSLGKGKGKAPSAFPNRRHARNSQEPSATRGMKGLMSKRREICNVSQATHVDWSEARPRSRNASPRKKQ